MLRKVSDMGQIRLSNALLEQWGISPGGYVSVEPVSNGLLIRPVEISHREITTESN